MNPLSIQKVIEIEPGQGIRTAGRIPQNSEFFQDHFPDFPILPGVLALEILKQTAEYYLKNTSEFETKRYFLKQVQAVKFSHYLKPGDEWESRLVLISEEEGQTRWNAKLYHQKKIAVSAELILSPIPMPLDLVAAQGG